MKRQLSIYLCAIIIFSHSSVQCGWYETLSSYFIFIGRNIAEHKEKIVLGTAALATSYAAYNYYRAWKMRDNAKSAIETAIRKDANKYIDQNLIVDAKFFDEDNKFKTYDVTSREISIAVNEKSPNKLIWVSPFYTCGFNKDNFKVWLNITYNIEPESTLKNLLGNSFVEKYPTGIQYKYVRYLFGTDIEQDRVIQVIDEAIVAVLKRAFNNWDRPDLDSLPKSAVQQNKDIKGKIFKAPIQLVTSLRIKPTAILLQILPSKIPANLVGYQKEATIAHDSNLYIQINGPENLLLVCELFFEKGIAHIKSSNFKEESGPEPANELTPLLQSAGINLTE